MRLLLLSLLSVFLLVGGCRAHLQGGSQRQEDTDKSDHGRYVVTIGPDGVKVDGKLGSNYSNHVAASTQPSLDAPADMIKDAKLEGGDLGSVGGISFKGMSRKNQSIILGLIFLAAAAGCYFIQKPLWCAAFAAGAILSFIAPEYLVYGAVLAVAILGYYAYVHFKQRNQIISGVAKLPERVDMTPEQVAGMKLVLKAEQDLSTSKAVDTQLTP